MKLSDLYIKLGLKKEGFDKGIDSAKKKTNAFGSAMKKIGGLVAGAFAVNQIFSFGKELLELGGIAEGVRAAFERIGGDKYLDGLKEATKGTVSELELMKRAVMASNFQIPIESLAALFKFATKRAQETGESVDYLVNSIVLGIGRKSPLILDNLGISAVRLRQELKGAGVEMNTVKDIAVAVGRIASEEMSKSGEIIETNAIKMQSLKASWDDLKESIATNKAVINTLNDSLTKTQQWLYVIGSDGATAMEKWAISIRLVDKRAEAIYNKVKKRDDELKDLRSKSSNELLAQLKKQEIAYSQLIMAQGGVAWGLGEEASELARLKRIIGEIITERQKNTKHIDYESEAYRNQIAAEQDAALEKTKHIQTIGELEAETEKLRKSLKLYNLEQEAEYAATEKIIKANEELLKSFGKIRESIPDMPLMESIGLSGNEFDTSIGFDTSSLANMDSFFKALSERIRKGKEDLLKETVDLRDALNEGFEQMIEESIGALAADFGEAIGSGDWSGFGENVLNAIGGFMQQLGALMIAYAINAALFSASVTNPLAWPLALAAGVAMVAAGAAVSSFASKGLGGGGSSATGYSPGSSSASQAISGNVSFVLEGDKLVGAINNNNNRRRITG